MVNKVSLSFRFTKVSAKSRYRGYDQDIGNIPGHATRGRPRVLHYLEEARCLYLGMITQRWVYAGCELQRC
jgi:hypothetical protein